MEKIAEKTGWGNHENWIHPHYVKLSKKIFEECNVLISVSSLKRFFGKIKSSHEPNREIRNTLARFIGYTDWDDFINKNPVAFQEKKEKEDIVPQLKKQQEIKNRKLKIIYASAGVLLLSLVLIYLNFRDKTPDGSIFQFTGKYLSGSSPHTVVFNYDVSKIKDSVFIDYDDSFDEKTREYLNPKYNTITHHYILPDLYRIRLICNNKTLYTLHAHLVTDGWQCYLGYDNKKKYFPIGFNVIDGIISINPDSIFSTGLVRKDEDVLIKYRLVQDFGINGDKFSLKATVKEDKKLKNLHCFFAAFVIHGDSSKIKVAFTQEECISKAWIICGDINMDGKYHDLSNLAADFSQWQNLEIMYYDKRLIIKIADKECFNLPLSIHLGTIRAVLFDTTPSGVLKDFSLTCI